MRRVTSCSNAWLTVAGSCAYSVASLSFCDSSALTTTGERLLLFTAEHAHRLLQLAVQRGRLLNRHADALGDAGGDFGGRGQFTEAALGGSDGAFEPFVCAIKGDEDGNSL